MVYEQMKIDSLSSEYLARTTHRHECPMCHREFKGYRDKGYCSNWFEWCFRCTAGLFEGWTRERVGMFVHRQIEQSH